MAYEKIIHFDKYLFPYVNPGKAVKIKVGDESYIRHVIRTHFIKIGEESYIDIIHNYVLPVYKEGDLLFISEKMITQFPDSVVTKKELISGFWAKVLCVLTGKSHGKVALSNDDACKVCNEIKNEFDISCVIADSSDTSIKILGWCRGIPYGIRRLKGMIRDNPSGCNHESASMILVREDVNQTRLKLKSAKKKLYK